MNEGLKDIINTLPEKQDDVVRGPYRVSPEFSQEYLQERDDINASKVLNSGHDDVRVTAISFTGIHGTSWMKGLHNR